MDLFGNNIHNKPSLKDIHGGAIPFSVLDLSKKNIQNIKKRWIAMGVQSEIGRDAAAFGYGGRAKENRNNSVLNDCYNTKWSTKSKNFYDRMTGGNSTSVFHPFLCEILYLWFCVPGGAVLDPFAGGSVRGIVANYYGFKYTGIDISQKQIDSNRDQSLSILPVDNQPIYFVGDSNNVLDGAWNKKFDFIFSCPPYADLETYSNLCGDISNISDYNYFLIAYASIIKKSVALLKNGSFACFVVGDLRDKKTGEQRGFVADTINIFRDNDMMLWNELIVLTGIGNAAIRVNMKNKKLTKIHQTALIFKKR